MVPYIHTLLSVQTEKVATRQEFLFSVPVFVLLNLQCNWQPRKQKQIDAKMH